MHWMRYLQINTSIERSLFQNRPANSSILRCRTIFLCKWPALRFLTNKCPLFFALFTKKPAPPYTLRLCLHDLVSVLELPRHFASTITDMQIKSILMFLVQILDTHVSSKIKCGGKRPKKLDSSNRCTTENSLCTYFKRQLDI